MRKIAEYSFNEKTARVYRDTEWNEYVVRYYSKNTHLDNSDYHTDCQSDAIDTAKTAIKDEREWCEANNLN